MSFVEHSYSVHCEKVNCMCRICGERVRRQIKDKLTTLKLCATYVKELNIHHGLDTARDKEDEHSKGLCTKCYQRLTACKRASSSAKSDTKTASDHAAADIEKAKRVWVKFNPEVSATQCTACSHFDTQCKGGRPKKLKVGAPKRSAAGSRSDSVADTELDYSSVTDLDFGSVANKELDCGSVTDIELDCSSVADKELDYGGVADKELDCGSVTDKELDCGSVAADKELNCGSVADIELETVSSSVADKESDCGSMTDIELDCSSVADKELDCGSVTGPSTSTSIKKRRTADTDDFPHHDRRNAAFERNVKNCGHITIPFSETERTETTRKHPSTSQ